MGLSQHFASGALSGFTSAILLQPLDVLKTRVQQGSQGRVSGDIPGVVRAICAREGVIGLWRGTVPTLLRNVPGQALYLTSVQQVRNAIGWAFPSSARTKDAAGERLTTLAKLTPTGNLVAGAVTRTAIGFMMNPLTVVKARYESDYYEYKSVVSALQSMVREGPRTLVQGFSATALRDAPYAGLYLMFYEGIKTRLASAIEPNNSGTITLVHTGSGATAATIATVLTHPFDAVKTRMQVRKEGQYRSISRAGLAIIRERGIAGLLDGVSLRLYRKTLSGMIGWGMYERVLLFLEEQQQQQQQNRFNKGA